MASITERETALRMLLLRLCWPVRMVRVLAAREYATLLSTAAYRAQATNVYLNWIRNCELENEVITSLAVLICLEDEHLPLHRDIRAAITRPSILADVLLQQIYGFGARGPCWLNAHSGPSPSGFEASNYFYRHRTADVPPIFSTHLQHLEEKYRWPFMMQWSYEWHTLMDQTKRPHSDFPYYFVGNLMRSNIVGQFDQSQSDVYRSAYLRTFACAYSQGAMPADEAGFYSTDCLPLNRGLLNLLPTDRPSWLSDIPERCCEASASLEEHARSIIRQRNSDTGMRVVDLRTPIKASLYEFGDLSVSAMAVTDNFVPDENDERYFAQETLWFHKNPLALDDSLDEEDLDRFRSAGREGSCLPICLSLTPIPFGFWHSDYVAAGLSLPASYNFAAPPDVVCTRDRIELRAGNGLVASLSVWHDQWSPLYPRGGETRCGIITRMTERHVVAAVERHGMRLGWVAQLRLWKRASDFGEFELQTRRAFFFD